MAGTVAHWADRDGPMKKIFLSAVVLAVVAFIVKMIAKYIHSGVHLFQAQAEVKILPELKEIKGDDEKERAYLEKRIEELASMEEEELLKKWKEKFNG